MGRNNHSPRATPWANPPRPDHPRPNHSHSRFPIPHLNLRLTVGAESNTIPPPPSSEGFMEDQLVETWLIHDRINRYLLDSLEADAVTSSFGPKHRSVFQLFAHMHNVRLLWLKPAA